MKKTILSAAIVGVLTAGIGTANATSTAQGLFNARYLNDDTACNTCHASATNTVANAVGQAWLGAGGTKTTAPTDWAAFETAAGSTFGGVDPNWTDPATTTTTTSSSSSSSGGCITSAVATPLMMVLAMLSLGFFVRRKKAK